MKIENPPPLNAIMLRHFRNQAATLKDPGGASLELYGSTAGLLTMQPAAVTSSFRLHLLAGCTLCDR